MNKENRLQNVLIILLAVAVVGMSIGFAALQSTLNINGNATFKAAKWEVIFANATETEGADLGNVTISNDKLTIDYSVVLKPNTDYTFNANVVNNGTFKAKLTSIEFTGDGAPSAINNIYNPKLSYTFKYNNVLVPESANASVLNTVIEPSASVPVEVSLHYPMPEAENALLDDDLPLTLGVRLTYQAVNE